MTYTPDISANADIIDSRDIIERIADLEDLRVKWIANFNNPGYMPDNDAAMFSDWADAQSWIVETLERHNEENESSASDDALEHALKQCDLWETDNDRSLTFGGYEYFIVECDDDDVFEDEDDQQEFRTLTALADEASGSPDWEHGESLIADSYFEEYAIQLAEDCGIEVKDEWPHRHIDWNAAANELKHDYFSVEYGNNTFWIRN